LIAGRFNVMTVSCIVLIIFMLLFIVNQQYMLKVIQKYHFRFLNHNGDMMAFFMILLTIGLFLFAKYGYNYE